MSEEVSGKCLRSLNTSESKDLSPNLKRVLCSEKSVEEEKKKSEKSKTKSLE